MSPAPLTPSDASRAVARFEAPSSRTRSKTTPCHARTSSSVAASSSAEARSRPVASASRASPGEALAPGSRRPLGGPLGRSAHDGLDAIFDRFLQVAVVCRLAADHALEPVAGPADPRLEAPHHISGSDHLVPAGEHFATEQRAAPQRRLDLVPRGGVRGVDLRPQLGCSRELLNHRCLDHRRPSGKARERTPKGPAHESRARLCIGGEIVEPCTNGRERRCGNETLRERSLRHDEHLRLGQAFVLEHLPQMRRHLATGVLRHAVEDEESAVPRSRAARRNSQGTASA